MLLAIVVTSYRQTIFAYPSGGGSYVVSRENLGANAAHGRGRVAARRLHPHRRGVGLRRRARDHVDSRSCTSLTNQRVLLCLAAIALITVANLRGIKESGRIFALPTYLYIFMLTGLVGWGLAHEFGLFGLHPFHTISFADVTKDLTPAQVADAQAELRIGAETVGTLGLFRLLRGFSSGAVALTGVEAISNGVPAFQRHESKNAATRSSGWAIILGTLFLGVSVLAHHLQPIPLETGESVFSQMGRTVFGQGVLYYVLQGATAAILTLAANTAYADFPRLSSIIARDGYLPRQLANRGDRLVFSNGVLVLAVAAGVLVVIFGGNESNAHPALRGRRVHVVHAVADRHGATSPEGARAGLAAQHRDQRGRRDRDARS